MTPHLRDDILTGHGRMLGEDVQKSIGGRAEPARAEASRRQSSGISRSRTI